MFCDQAIEKKEIRDRIVDEHSLLLFIKWSAERPKQNRQGHDIPGTFIGAVSIQALIDISCSLLKLFTHT
jgi:hypothetical protein